LDRLSIKSPYDGSTFIQLKRRLSHHIDHDTAILRLASHESLKMIYADGRPYYIDNLLGICYSNIVTTFGLASAFSPEETKASLLLPE